MELVNNRFRIVKNLKIHKLYSSYLVSDIKRNFEIIQLNIVNYEYIPQELIDFYIEEFIELKSIFTDNILKIFNFGSVFFIDNKKIDNNKYFYYTNEYLEKNIELFDLTKRLDENKILDLFVQLCKAVNYLHLKGVIYKQINTNNIFINFDGEKYIFKINDLVSVGLENNLNNYVNNSMLFFRAPEVLLGKTPTVKSNIYSLGVLMFYMINRNINVNLSLSKQISSFFDYNLNISNRSYSKFFMKNIYEIIIRMISEKPDDRYENINELIGDINQRLKKHYIAFNKYEIEKLNFKTKIVGREQEIKNIIKENNFKSNIKIIKVHGQAGIGKTRLLRELCYTYNFKESRVFCSFEMDSFKKINYSVPVLILKQIIGQCDKEVISKYENELIKIIPEIGNGQSIIPSEPLGGEIESYRLMNRIGNLIFECIKNNSAIFIIDNLHYASDFTIDLLEYLFSKPFDSKISLIFSYNDEEYSYNKRFKDFLYKYKDSFETKDMKLRGLDYNNTEKMVNNILGYSRYLEYLTKCIYSKSFGNPRFIEEILKDLFAKNIIFVGNMGRWCEKYDKYTEVIVPGNMNQVLLSQLNEIGQFSREILNIISIFNTSAYFDNICNFFEEYKRLDVEKELQKLSFKGILSSEFINGDYLYEFNNKILKNLIYSKMSDTNKRDKHKQAAEILEKKYNNKSDIDELIYHFEKAEMNDKVISFCIDSAKRKEKIKNIKQEIRYIEKALYMFEEDSVDDRKIELLMKLGKLMIFDYKIDLSLEYFHEVEEISSRKNKFKYEIDALNSIARVYQKKNNSEKTFQFIKKIEKILEKINYKQGYLEAMYTKQVIYFQKNKDKKAYDICQQCLELCKDDHSIYTGKFHIALGNIYYIRSKYDQALQYYNDSLKYFNEADYPEGIVIANNNIGEVYFHVKNNLNKASECFINMKDICEKYSLTEYQIAALSSLSDLYYSKLDYEAAFESSLKALELSKTIQYESYIFDSYNQLTTLCLKTDKYGEAYKYHMLAKKELEEYPDQSIEIGQFYKKGAELFLELGNIDKAKQNIDKALKICQDDKMKYGFEITALKELIELGRVIDEEEIDENVEKSIYAISKINDSGNKKDILYDTAILVFDNNPKLVRDILVYIDKFDVQCENKIVNIKRMYLEAILYKECDAALLEEVLQLAKKQNQKKLEWEICNSIGNYYIKRGVYFNAINYFLEACEIIKSLTQQLPKELRLNYVKYHRMEEPFEKLVGLDRKYCKNQSISIEDFRLDIHCYKDLEKIFSYGEVKDLFNNKEFIETAKNIYNSIISNGVRNLKDIVRLLQSNSLKNLEVIIRYLTSITLATKGMIIQEDINKNYSVIASSCKNSDEIKNRYVLEKSKVTAQPILISEALNRNKEVLKYVQGSVKACMCIPVVRNDKVDNVKMEDDMRKNNYYTKNIVGYIYLESERAFNNINEDSMNECMELAELIAFIIEKYKLKLTSSIDKLTGTLTRKFLEHSLIKHIQKASNSNEKLSILMFDLDDFKEINDKFGHQTGDEVLHKVCSIVMNNIRKEDICGRYGGEEFIVILPGINSENALKTAEKLKQKIHMSKVLGEKRDVTISVGIATYPEQGLWIQELIEKVDQALYVAKENGKNRCELWKGEFSNKAKLTDKLTGIISGNAIKNYRNVSVIVEIIELIKKNINIEDRIYQLLGRIIEITEAEYGILFKLDDNNVFKEYGRKKFEKGWKENNKYNKTILNSVLHNKMGIYKIDWDEINEYDAVTGIPNWYSIIAVPLIKFGYVKGILYLGVSIKFKEFNYEDYNFVNLLAQLSASLL